MLKVENISFAYRNRLVLRELSMELQPGELVALLGVNGSGKTTLLKNLNRLLRPKHGAVLVQGQDLARLTPRQIARVFSYMPQKNNGGSGTVFDAVLLGRKPHIEWDATADDHKIVADTLRLLGMADYAMRPVTELSGGELQKVMIARALAQAPQILLLDEPISHLDIGNQLSTMGLLRGITRRNGLTVVTVLHDLSIALRFADRFVMLKDGAVLAAGSCDSVTPAMIKQVYGIDAAIHRLDGVPVLVPT